tara:strand:- start:3959 stop:4078 length:120 start_codon:yes stop_codon:yes gene_type:complete
LYTPPVVVSDDGGMQVIGLASAGKTTDISSIEEAKVVTR